MLHYLYHSHPHHTPGGYNVTPLVDCLEDPELADIAVEALSHTLLVFDAFYDVEEKSKAGNAGAKKVMESWAAAEWFHSKPKVAEKITVTVFKVTGETNTDDLSPAPDAFTRPDIPKHANAMLKLKRDGINGMPAHFDCSGDLEEGKPSTREQMDTLKEKG